MEGEERSRVRAVQIYKLRGLLGIRRMARVLNALIRKLCGVRKGLDEKIDEGVLLWFGHVERMERVGSPREWAGNRSVGRPRKRWIDTEKECLRKKRFRCQASKENGPG